MASRVNDTAGGRLADIAEAAYRVARREVFDVGLREGSATLTLRQVDVLNALRVAEANVAEHRRQRRLAAGDGEQPTHLDDGAT